MDEARDSQQLRKRFKRMLVTLIVAALAAVLVTYAWYIYNANRHVTDVKMAAGTGSPSLYPTTTTANTSRTPAFPSRGC